MVARSVGGRYYGTKVGTMTESSKVAMTVSEKIDIIWNLLNIHICRDCDNWTQEAEMCPDCNLKFLESLSNEIDQAPY